MPIIKYCEIVGDLELQIMMKHANRRISYMTSGYLRHYEMVKWSRNIKSAVVIVIEQGEKYSG